MCTIAEVSLTHFDSNFKLTLIMYLELISLAYHKDDKQGAAVALLCFYQHNPETH